LQVVRTCMLHQGDMCVTFFGSIEDLKSQFGSRNLKIQDREVEESPGGKGGCISFIISQIF